MGQDGREGGGRYMKKTEIGLETVAVKKSNGSVEVVDEQGD